MKNEPNLRLGTRVLVLLPSNAELEEGDSASSSSYIVVACLLVGVYLF